MDSTKLRFETHEDVTRYLNLHFPERECSETPGVFLLPGNDKFEAVEVFCKTVNVYLKRQ